MKRKFSLPLTIAASLLVLALTNCKKDQSAAPQNDVAANLSSQQSLALISATTPDRIDAIVKDLSLSNYSLSFESTIPSAGITKTAYGADNYLTFADPGDLICGESISKVQKRIPIWKIPTFVTPTCPTMIIDPLVALALQQYLVKAAPLQFRGLEGIKISNGGTLLATQTFVKPYAGLKPDRIDDITKGLNAERFLLLNDQSNPSGLFTRNFYGYADLGEFLFKPYKKSLKDILKPKYIGCFDPQILKVIRERFQEISPAVAKNLGITQIANAPDMATLSF